MNTIIHVGYPKAGSTFLQEYFKQHPDISYDRNVWQHYWPTGEVNIAPISTDRKFLVLSEEQLSAWHGRLDRVGMRFHPYDVKAHQLKVARALHAYNNNAKVLIVTRGFYSAIHSLYSEYLKNGGILKFNDFLKEYGSMFVDFYDYNYLLKVYRELFGAENVVLLPFELLKNDVKQFMNLIETELGFPHFTFTEKVNVSLEASELPAYRRLSATVCSLISGFSRPTQERLYAKYFEWLYGGKINWLVWLFSSKEEKNVIDEGIRKAFIGKGEILRNEKLFAPYHAEYLL